jgi:hypothetical protein
MIAMRSNLRNVILLNGILVDISGEYIRENNEERSLSNNELDYINDQLNYEFNNELNEEIDQLNNEILLFLINRSDRTYYLFANMGKELEKDTLTKEEIENLEKFEVLSNCPICMEETDKNIKLNCNHIFCSLCIEKWLLDKSNTCPTCRVKVK